MNNIVYAMPTRARKLCPWGSGRQPTIIWLIMKLTLFFSVLFTFQVSANTLAQKVNLDLRNASFRSIMVSIQQQTHYSFVAKEELLKSANSVSIKINAKDLAEVLPLLFEGQPFSYQVNGKIITLKELNAKKKQKSSPHFREAVQQHIHGRVTNEKGEPISGVSVVIKGTSIGTSTTPDGRYEIEMPIINSTLVFSAVGFVMQEVAIQDKLQISIMLIEDSTNLDEVVVIGMDNRQTKRSVTGAISTIHTKELKQSPVANLSNALAGRLPGLITVQATGQPGNDEATLFIRGRGTYGNSAPLVVIDGLPRAQADFNQLDANEIESVTILKDAASTSLYGIQGANGVIVVTTKRGSSSLKPEINFTGQQALQQAIRLPRMMDAYDQALYFKDVDLNSDVPVRYTDEVLEIIRTGSDPYQYPNVKWFDEILKERSLQNQYNLNISGSASSGLRYFVSGSYIKQGTLLKHQDVFEDNYGVKSKFDRYNFRSNVDLDATSRLNIRIDLAGRLENRTGPGPGFSEIFSDITGRYPSSQPVFNPDGSLGAGSALEIPYHRNPYGLVTQNGYYTDYTNVMYGTLAAKHKLDFIADGLDAQIYFSFENNNNKVTQRLQDFDSYWFRGNNNAGNPVYQQFSIKSRLATSGSSFIRRYNYFDFRLNYNKSFQEHSVRAQLLANRTLQMVNDELPYAYQGVSGHFTYDFKSRYFLELNLGYNGSENFPPNRRYGFFPAVSAGWILSDESFFNNNLVRYLKLRGSYGVAGNDKIGGQRWLYISDFAPGGGYRLGVSPTNVPGYNENRVGNNHVTWERAVKSNFGLELALFQHREIELSFDVFREMRNNILTPPGNVPDFVAISGLAPRNTGQVLNRGFEGEVRFQKRFNDKWSMFTNFQLTYARNKVLENDQPTPAFDYQDLRGYEIGHNLGYKSLGFFQDYEDIANSPTQSFANTVIPGDVKYADINQDGVIDAFDRVPIRTQSIPRYIGGLSMGVSYSRFDASVLINGARGRTTYVYSYPGSLLNLRRWTPDNMDDAVMPVASVSSNNTLLSDQFIQKADYLKIRNAELGYEFSQRLLAPLKISYARLYINAQNLAVWDSLWLKDRDPESPEGHIVYPIQRVINLGVNIRL